MKKSVSAFLSVISSTLILAAAAPQSIAAEEQIFIEDLTPSQLRSEIKKIETEFYRVFNASLDDDELSVVCYDHLPTGSNIKREVCEPQFVVDKRAENANDSQFGVDSLLTAASLQRDLADEFEALNKAMVELAEESEYFSQLNGILAALRDELENR